MMRTEIKRLGISAAAVYIVAFLLIYLFGCWVATLPVLSPVSLARAFDTVGKRLHFAMTVSFWVLLMASPFLFLWSKRGNNQMEKPNKPPGDMR